MTKQPLAALGLLVTLTACHGFGPPALTLPEKPASMQEIETALEKSVAAKNPPGLVIAVVKGEETRYLKAFGVADGSQDRPLTERSVHQWWSITKLFTVVAVLQLAEDRKLTLDDPVTKHLPFVKFRGKVGHDSVITIRHLLSHGSGLGDIGMSILGWIHYEGDPHPNQTELLKTKLPKYNKVKIEPGREGRYSNFGYLMLAAVIESASGQSYEDYVRSRILAPLDMTRTDFVYTEAMRDDEAIGSHPRDAVSFIVPFYIDMDRTVREKKDGIYWFNRVYSDQKGATGLIGSAEDMIKFAKMLLNDGISGRDGIRILSPASIALMQEPFVPIVKSPAPTTKDMAFGLGWFIRRTRYEDNERITWTHGGAGMGHIAMLQITRTGNKDDDLAVLAVANSTWLGKTMGLDIVEKVGALNW